MHVIRTFWAISYFFGINSKPSKDIRVSLIQSKNQWYPAIIEYVLNKGLSTMKLSAAIRNVFINLSLSISSLLLFSFPLSINFDSLNVSHSLTISFVMMYLASNSSIFSSSEQINDISFSSSGSISISYLPGTI